MVSAISNNEHNRVSYGAVKDVVPQQVSQKLPENIQNIDGEKIKTDAVNATKQTWAGSVLEGFGIKNLTLEIHNMHFRCCWNGFWSICINEQLHQKRWNV
jgi:hypothetical protein